MLSHIETSASPNYSKFEGSRYDLDFQWMKCRGIKIHCFSCKRLYPYVAGSAVTQTSSPVLPTSERDIMLPSCQYSPASCAEPLS